MRADSGPYLAADIVAACEGLLMSGDPAASFDGISTDSRDVRPNDLFVPIQGPNFDGHDFVLPALEAGARGSLLGRDTNRGNFHNPSNFVLIQVQDTLQALSDLASAHRLRHTLPLIAVTGSSGKTTVKEMIAAVLGRSHRPLVSPGNLNNMIGLPMTVLNLGSHHTAAVVEAGINVIGEMEHLAKAASPDTAVITTIGPVHLEGLGSVERVAREKFHLVRRVRPDGTAVLPSENPYLVRLVEGCQRRIVYFGIEFGDFRASNIQQTGDGTSFLAATPDGTQPMTLRVPGLHNVANALAAAAACVSIGVSLTDVAAGLNSFTVPPGRMEIVPLSGGRMLIRDCYNANPQSVSVALEVLAQKGRGGKTLAILANMMELGTAAERLHAEVGRKSAALSLDRLVFVGSYGSPFEQGFIEGGGDKQAIALAADKDEAWHIVQPDLKSFYAVLVKGSRAMKMETIADLIAKEI